MVFLVYYLESRDTILKITHNIHFHDKIRKHLTNPNYFFSWAIGKIYSGLKNEFESSKKNEPSITEVLLYMEHQLRSG